MIKNNFPNKNLKPLILSMDEISPQLFFVKIIGYSTMHEKKIL